MDAMDALDYAKRAAYGAIGAKGADVAQDVEDIALEALARCYRGGADPERATIAATVRNVTHEYWRERYQTRALSLDAEDENGGSLSDSLSQTTDEETGETVLEATVAGLTVRVPVDRHGMDIERATVSDASGRVLDSGPAAIRALEAVRRQTARTGSAGAQQARATDRDVAVLAVEGMRWQDALLTLEAQGISLSRGALREAQRVARRRLAGGTAKG